MKFPNKQETKNRLESLMPEHTPIENHSNPSNHNPN